MEKNLLIVEALVILFFAVWLLISLLYSIHVHPKDCLHCSFCFILITIFLLNLSCIICQSVFLRRIIDHDLSYDCSDKITNEIHKIENLNNKNDIKYTAVNLGLDCFFVLFNLFAFLIIIIIDKLKWDCDTVSLSDDNDFGVNKNNEEVMNKKPAKEVIVDNATLSLGNKSDKLADNNNISPKDADNIPKTSQE